MLFFASTVFISAFLLFQIQPMIAKIILPWFGGSSSVWSTCMVFFQLELLAGYAYVHLIHEKLSPRRQVWVHAGLLLASLLTLPVAANPAWKELAQTYPMTSLLAVLASAVGAPYLLLSTTGPLMQAWYVRTFAHRIDTAHPYRLYALSNLASMLALLSYPVLVEPVFELRYQSWGWSAGYALFVASCLLTARFAYARMTSTLGHATESATPPAAPRWSDYLVWIGLSATASILLLALTRHMTQDVAPVPFLWVLPLAIYLLSFILTFDAPRYYVRPLFLAALPVALWAIDRVLDGGFDVPEMVALILFALSVFCMVCHGELVRRKPPVQYLTAFYLMISIGGALGGVLVGLVAPSVFTAYFELPLGLFLCALLITVVLWPELARHWRALLVLALLGYAVRLGSISLEYVEGYRTVVRNFYSQLRVAEVEDPPLGTLRTMRHGRITHGEQYMDAAHRRAPTAYYCERSGVGRTLQALRGAQPLHVGILGLGVGTLVTYGRQGDAMRLYEINEQVLDLARADFSYLADSPATLTTVLGDGRLVLEREAPNQFDLLVMDAFSGDSIPTHLLTLEAMKIYLGHLKPDGLLAVHITNHYLDMRPVMAAAAAHYGREALVFDLEPASDDLWCRHSVWVLVARPERLQQLQALHAHATPLRPTPGFAPWTDSFSNLFSILKTD